MVDEVRDRRAPLPTESARPTPWWPAVALAVLCLALYAPGLRWGLPATVSWSQDTIAGVRTLGSVETWPDNWAGRYPPCQYLILHAIYHPYLKHLLGSGEAVREPATGRVLFKPPQDVKVGTLLLIARCTSLVMAIGAVLALYMAALRLLGDALAAAIAAGVLAISAAYTYFAHLGNVDVPSVFWFAVSVLFYVRLLSTRSVSDAVFLGLFGSLAISTKDSVAGVYPGMAIVLFVVEAARHRDARTWFGAACKALAQWRWLAGLVAFALPYLFLTGVFHNHVAYLSRMSYWLGITPDTIHVQQHRYDNQLALLGATLRYAAGAIGWPMLIAILVSMVYAVRRHARLAGTVLAPVCTYYLIIIMPQGFVYSRFLFPPLALLGILVGVGSRDFVRATLISWHVRFGVVTITAMLTLGYAVAIDAEMITDSRYDVERWFEQNVANSSSIGAFSKPQYLPRLPEMGYQTFGVEMTRDAFTRSQPDYLVLTSYNYVDFDAREKQCMQALLHGELGYQPVAQFRPRFLMLGSASWLSLAGWAAPVPGKISPHITIMKRTTP